MKKSKNNKDVEKNESFIEKMKNDKKYNAKVQLIGYGIFIGALVLYVNIAGLSHRNTNLNSVNMDSMIDNENINNDDKGLLDRLSNNYSYDVVVNVSKKDINNKDLIIDRSIRYVGKSFGNKLQIEKIIGDVTEMYYKVDSNYYINDGTTTNYVMDEKIYEDIDSKYIELSNVLNLINKASLDHVTKFSNGKKESVYHLKVSDVIVSHKGNEVVEISIVEENEVITIDINYSNLFVLIDDKFIECKVLFKISDINKVEDFDVFINNNENKDNA